MKRKAMRFLSLGLTLLMIVGLMGGCQQKEEAAPAAEQAQEEVTPVAEEAKEDVAPADTEKAEEEEWLEYTFAFYDDSISSLANNPNDVVTEYVNEKFKIKVSEVFVVRDEDFKERLSQWIASDTMPDVICTGEAKYALSVAAEKFAVLDEYVDKMENYNKYFNQEYWPRYMTDGHKYILPNVTLNLNAEEYQADPWNPGDDVWGLWVREDILEMCGYSFTPIADIQAATTEQGLKPTLKDFAIEPAIETPEDFYAFLQKVKDLNLTVGGKDVIPLSIPAWAQFHFGAMYDWGHWRIDENGDVGGYMGLPGAKSYYWLLTQMYNEGLIDKDFLIQKDEQLQEKIASGRVACGMYAPDLNAAMQILKQTNEEAEIRYIPWPKETEGKGYFDIYQGGGWSYLVSSDLSDEELERLTQYFDWFYSDEGLDIITWGPESAGLWEINEDGKKVFVDEEVKEACLQGIHDQKGADYYGLYDASDSRTPFQSLAAMATPCMTHGNPMDYARSYEPNLNILAVNKSLCGSSGVDYKGLTAADDGGENSLAVSNFFWSNFAERDVADLLVCTTEEEFNAAWDAMYQQFLTEGKYEEAVVDMKAWFDVYGPQ